MTLCFLTFSHTVNYKTFFNAKRHIVSIALVVRVCFTSLFGCTYANLCIYNTPKSLEHLYKQLLAA